MKKRFLAIILGLCLVFSFTACSSDSSDSSSADVSDESAEAEEESHIYDDAEIIDVMNGAGTSVVSQESLILADSADITMEDLEDWYFNYIAETDYDWYVILYTDSDDNSGIYGVSGYIEVDVTFSESSENVYSESGTDGSTMYLPSDDGTLTEYGAE